MKTNMKIKMLETVYTNLPPWKLPLDTILVRGEVYKTAINRNGDLCKNGLYMPVHPGEFEVVQEDV